MISLLISDAQISITLKDDGVISLIFGEDRLKEDQVLGDFAGTRKKGTQLMDQTELKKGNKGYDVGHLGLRKPILGGFLAAVLGFIFHMLALFSLLRP